MSFISPTPHGSRFAYPFADLQQIGDGLFIDDYKRAESARVAGIQFVRRHQLSWKIGIRKVSGGWRVMRTR
jgi:hypothetical protein